MNIFDEVLLETEINYMESCHFINFCDSISDDIEIVLESGGEFNLSTFFDSLIKKIKQCITNIKDKIMGFFNSTVQQEKISKIEEEIKKDPKLAKKQKQTINYAELDKLNDLTLRDLQNVKDVEEKMIKYRKQRNKILKVGAVITLTLGSALIIIKKSKDKKINDLNSKLKTTESNFERLKSRYTRVKTISTISTKENKKLKDDNELLRTKNTVAKVKIKGKQISRDISKTGGKADRSIQIMKQTALAQTEVLSNASKDVVNYIKDAASVCTNGGTSTTKKVGTVVKTMKSTTSTIADAVNGTSKKKISGENATKTKEKINAIIEKRNKARSVISSPKTSEETKKKAKTYLNVSDEILKKLKTSYAISKNDALK